MSRTAIVSGRGTPAQDFPLGPGRCDNAAMDDTEKDTRDDPGTGGAMGRRAFFGRALLAAGAVGGLLTLTGCPGGEQDDGDDDDGDDD